MLNSIRFHHRSFLALAFLIALAQGLLLWHQVDFDAHVDNERCDVCIHISHLAHAAVDSGASLVPPAGTHHSATRPAAPGLFGAVKTLRPPSRAPPLYPHS